MYFLCVYGRRQAPRTMMAAATTLSGSVIRILSRRLSDESAPAKHWQLFSRHRKMERSPDVRTMITSTPATTCSRLGCELRAIASLPQESERRGKIERFIEHRRVKLAVYA